MVKQLTAREANRLAINQQVTLIKLLEISLENTYQGKSWLFGKQIFSWTLIQAKNRLTELDRQQQAYDRDLPVYMNGNGAYEGKTKAHFSATGGVQFIETKEGASGDGVQGHLETKTFHKQQQRSINQKNKQTSPDANTDNNMATKKATAAKKTASKSATKTAAKKSAAKKQSTGGKHKGTRTAQQFRDDYDKDPKNFNVAEYAAKYDVAYGRVYGAIVKHEAAKAASKKGGKK